MNYKSSLYIVVGLAAFVFGAGADTIYRTQIAPPPTLPRPESVGFSHTPDGQPYQEVFWYCRVKQHDASKDCPIDYLTSTHALDPDKRWGKAHWPKASQGTTTN